MSVYEFSGKVEMGRETQPFTHEVEAETKKHAKDIIYAELGSKHSVPRSSIELDESEEA
ncbi:MAG: 50S ribosomal protein L18Ae [Candidatus Nanohaloarchaea archaeon]